MCLKGGAGDQHREGPVPRVHPQAGHQAHPTLTLLFDSWEFFFCKESVSRDFCVLFWPLWTGLDLSTFFLLLYQLNNYNDLQCSIYKASGLAILNQFYQRQAITLPEENQFLILLKM